MAVLRADLTAVPWAELRVDSRAGRRVVHLVVSKAEHLAASRAVRWVEH